jgi:hypothetical protein
MQSACHPVCGMGIASVGAEKKGRPASALIIRYKLANEIVRVFGVDGAGEHEKISVRLSHEQASRF